MRVQHISNSLEKQNLSMIFALIQSVLHLLWHMGIASHFVVLKKSQIFQLISCVSVSIKNQDIHQHITS